MDKEPGEACSLSRTWEGTWVCTALPLVAAGQVDSIPLTGRDIGLPPHLTPYLPVPLPPGGHTCPELHGHSRPPLSSQSSVPTRASWQLLGKMSSHGLGGALAHPERPV